MDGHNPDSPLLSTLSRPKRLVEPRGRQPAQSRATQEVALALHFFACDSSRKFRGHHPHLSCFFQGTELRDWLGFGERSPRLDAVGVSVILTPPAPPVANAKLLERSKS